MDREKYEEYSPFAVDAKTKAEFFKKELSKLSEYHRSVCKAYDDICNGLNDPMPYLPVSIFKELKLCSVPDDKIIRRVTSSGTTGQKVSQIFLDADTSTAQQRALCLITGDFIGGDRIPMLIIDSPDVLRDRTKYSARGAGIMGFSIMASKRFYAFDNEFNLDWESIEAFAEACSDGPGFAFGFTYMIWAYFYKALMESDKKVDLSGCYLIHGGGWKKLQDQKVSDEEFKRGLKDACGIEKVSDYYGMAEQTGSIFMQCEEGHLHASMYSDISIVNPEDFSECEDGEEGLIALESYLPESYPGHRLITEDWGRIIGTDSCPCGRKGKYFEIRGRIKKAEVRGCSDTFESHNAVNGDEMQVLAGTYPPEKRVLKAFAPEVLEFLRDLSTLLMKDIRFRSIPEIYALGFWCRGSHLEQIMSRYNESRQGKGLTLHIAPSNMPTMFAYSWITSLLAGNPGVVRISGRDADISRIVLEGIKEILNKEEHRTIRNMNAFMQFPRDSKALYSISSEACVRVIWGGDDTVKRIQEIPGSENCIDIAFPDKYSIALFDAAALLKLDEDELRMKAHLFFNDTYSADQNACSSPRVLFWLADNEETSAKAGNVWWNALAKEAEKYDFQPRKATEKYCMACCSYAENKGLMPMKKWGNRLYVIPFNLSETDRITMDAKFGMFYECRINSEEEMLRFLEEKIQTIVTIGIDNDGLLKKIREAGCAGVDRIVVAGEALDFDTVWDRKDLIGLMSR